MTRWYLPFSLIMTLVIMILAAWALPGLASLVLLVPSGLGAVWAFCKLRRAGSAGDRSVDRLPRE